MAKPDTIIRVDRGIPPRYPHGTIKVMNPALDMTGPPEYDLGQMTWSKDPSKLPRNFLSLTYGYFYYDLKRNSLLASCLGLRDGEEIQKKGITVFREIRGVLMVPLWKGVVRNQYRSLVVPGLVGSEDGRGKELLIEWFDFSQTVFLAPPTTIRHPS